MILVHGLFPQIGHIPQRVLMQGLLESFKGNMVQSLTQAFHTVLFVNGTECDITGLPRSARVEVCVCVKMFRFCDYIKRHCVLLCTTYMDFHL